MKIVEIDGKLYKDPTGYGLGYVPVEERTIEECFDSILETEYEELYPERPIEL